MARTPRVAYDQEGGGLKVPMYCHPECGIPDEVPTGRGREKEGGRRDMAGPGVVQGGGRIYTYIKEHGSETVKLFTPQNQRINSQGS